MASEKPEYCTDLRGDRVYHDEAKCKKYLIDMWQLGFDNTVAYVRFPKTRFTERRMVTSYVWGRRQTLVRLVYRAGRGWRLEAVRTPYSLSLIDAVKLHRKMTKAKEAGLQVRAKVNASYGTSGHTYTWLATIRPSGAIRIGCTKVTLAVFNRAIRVTGHQKVFGLKR